MQNRRRRMTQYSSQGRGESTVADRKPVEKRALTVDGRARAALGQLGPTHPTGSLRAGWRWNLLCPVALQPLRSASGDSVFGAQLVRRQHGWDAGPGSSATAAALWLLRGMPFGGHLWRGRADVRVYYSGFLHWQTAIAMLVAFLLLSCESLPALHTPCRVFNFRKEIFRSD